VEYALRDRSGMYRARRVTMTATKAFSCIVKAKPPVSPSVIPDFKYANVYLVLFAWYQLSGFTIVCVLRFLPGSVIVVCGVFALYLSAEEERILRGFEGEARARALEVIVRVGEALGASRLIEIKHAHISGVSYENIGDFGVEFIEGFRALGARFSVPTSVNPVSYDVDDLSSIPGVTFERSYVEAQEAIVRALRDMGADLIFTCTPYYAGIPEVYGLKAGDHVAWGESSAVAYANSVLGIRTNREGGPLALMAAIAGRTYYYGMHVEGERKPTISYVLEPRVVLDEVEAGVLGELVARMHVGERPPHVVALFEGDSALKEFLAALGTVSDIAMAHIHNITPENPGDEIKEVVKISYNMLEEELREKMPTDEVDIVYIGCPHSSLEELMKLAKTLEGTGTIKARIVVSTSREVYLKALKLGLVERLRRAKANIVRSSCLIVSPFANHNRGVKVATNSYKAYHYLSRKGVKAYLTRISYIKHLAKT
jgi:predicted aconitase